MGDFMEQEIIKLYKKYNSVRKVSLELNLGRGSITQILTENNIFDCIKLPDEMIGKSICDMYVNQRVSIEKMAKIFKMSQTKISAILKYYGVKENNKLKSIKFDEDYFENIDTEHKAYFLGLIFADGYNSTDKYNLEITLKSDDLHILEEFEKQLNTYNKIKDKCVNGVIYKRMLLSSKKMSTDLEKIGCIQNKSLVLKFPKIRKDLENHFIRGYFDGDGCISINLDKKYYSFRLIGTKDFLNKVIELMDMQKVKLQPKGTNKLNYQLGYGGRNNIIKIRNYLYKNSTIYLNRKYNKFFKL